MPTWKYLLKSLYSNQTIIDGRRRPWYWAVIFFVLSIFLMIVVPMSQTYLNDGTSFFMPGNDAEVGRALYELSKDERFQKLYIENGILKDSSLGPEASDFSYDGVGSEDSFFRNTSLENASKGAGSAITTPYDYESYVFYASIGNDADGRWGDVPILSVFSTDLDPIHSKQGAKDLSIAVNKVIYRSIDESGEPSTENIPVNRSFMILCPTGFYIYMYSPLPQSYNDTDAQYPVASQGSQYSSYFVGSFEKIQSFNFSELACEGPYTLVTEERNSDYAQNWFPFVSETYYPIRNRSLWKQLGIVMGVTAGGMLLSGLVIWLFTLGRKNLLHKNCNAWEGLKMGATLSFTVALISCFLYFLGTTYAWMFGVMGLILRTMWLIMKTTGSRNQGEQKPLYQARQ